MSLYLLAIFCRIFCAFFSFGYIHPDEWKQSLEPIGGLLGLKTDLPWEFQDACRSYFPLFLYYIPLKWITSLFGSDGRTLFYGMRLICLLLSFLVDVIIYVILKRNRKDPFPVLTLHGFSWCTLVFLVRPFSNSLEMILVGASILLHRNQPFLLGMVCAFGCFVRITFPGYAGILVLMALLTNTYKLRYIWKFLFGALLITSLGMYIDSVIYGKWGIIIFLILVFTPLNNLIYNLNTDNLALHGIHSRWTHLLVNFPILYLSIIPFLKEWHPVLFPVLTGMSILSLMPHQELRFLVPAHVCLLICIGLTQTRFNRLAIRFFFLFNLICTVFFGFCHQSGVIPAILSVDTSLPIYFYKVYTPPISLFGKPSDSSLSVSVLDAPLDSFQVPKNSVFICPVWIMNSQNSTLLFFHVGLDQLDLLIKSRPYLGIYN